MMQRKIEKRKDDERNEKMIRERRVRVKRRDAKIEQKCFSREIRALNRQPECLMIEMRAAIDGVLRVYPPLITSSIRPPLCDSERGTSCRDVEKTYEMPRCYEMRARERAKR